MMPRRRDHVVAGALAEVLAVLPPPAAAGAAAAGSARPPLGLPPGAIVAEWACEAGICVPTPTGAIDFPSWLFTGHLGAGQFQLNPLFPSKPSECTPWCVSQDCISLSHIR